MYLNAVITFVLGDAYTDG